MSAENRILLFLALLLLIRGFAYLDFRQAAADESAQVTNLGD